MASKGLLRLMTIAESPWRILEPDGQKARRCREQSDVNDEPLLFISGRPEKPLAQQLAVGTAPGRAKAADPMWVIHLVRMITDGDDRYTGLVRFMENLAANPSRQPQPQIPPATVHLAHRPGHDHHRLDAAPLDEDTRLLTERVNALARQLNLLVAEQCDPTTSIHQQAAGRAAIGAARGTPSISVDLTKMRPDAVRVDRV